MTKLSPSAQRISSKLQDLFQKLRYSPDKERWSKHDLDTWAEYAQVLADKAPKGEASLGGEALLCFAQVAYWQGLFPIALLFCKLAHPKLQGHPQAAICQLLRAQAATQAFVYDARNERERLKVAKMSESALTQLLALPQHAAGFQTELFVAAAHQWHLSGLPELAASVLSKISFSERNTARRMVLDQDAPAFWRERHRHKSWQDTAIDLLK